MSAVSDCRIQRSSVPRKLETISATPTVGNVAPIALPDGYTTYQNTSINISWPSGVLANDTDVDGNTLTAALVSTTSHGTLTLNANGGFFYNPANGFTRVHKSES